MGSAAPARYTYDDLLAMPEDLVRREIIDGELIVSPSPSVRHQRAVTQLIRHLANWTDDHGGEVLPGPFDVFVRADTVVQPDVLVLGPARAHLLVERPLTVPPDLVVEVSSPSTRRLDLTRRLDVYQRFAVAEHWFVDLEQDLVEVRRLRVDGRYAAAVRVGRGHVLGSRLLPGFALAVDRVLGPADG
ncbi:MAG TPA: Uma2 family endonuclease [Nitriliruptorales bacterium]|nr:Uma2 family endonuclease [Nitriliruptorales bacterium]